MIMKITFKNRLAAIDWIANNVEDEGQFEVLREQLNYNFIYTSTYYLNKSEKLPEVVWLDQNKK